MPFRSVLREFFLIGLMMCMAACATSRGGSIPYAPQDFVAPDAPAAVPSEAAYKLSPLDTVDVTVFQVPDLSHEYIIDLSGKLNMPLLGSINAVGLTPTELAGEVQQKLAATYMQNPNVTVSLKASARRVVTVDGSVQQPGVFPAIGPLTLIQAIALAHGTDDLANPHRVAVFRTIGGERKAAAFDLVSIRRGEMKDPPVYAGDTIVVDGSGVKQAQRQLLQAIPLGSLFITLGGL